MIREGSTRDTYTGKSGQMAVLAELLSRKCNVAVPEVDEGEDVLAFALDEPDVTRIQVKTANAERLKDEGRYAARVSVPLEQLRDPLQRVLFYLFANRLNDQWSDFVVISRADLRERNESGGMGYVHPRARELQLYLSFSPDALACSGQDLQPYRNAWGRLPVLGRRQKKAGA
jgi:hypothetical protein